ncbi:MULTISPECIES: SDR family oxidoreductase [unclassified Actinopolyspora]|uniref:SDR family oxidoreductase n=1 Tax=unclassified Actinopolyspora TaxID=2639451 RepID=UPI0013F61C2A|nr:MULTISPECIES: SDR family oxidoreductase [unclassified Actinopolyspora]NHD15986.1 SDR family oxidoreductase [Actinopolyspora sp. BKK2]NHE74800.1 SDR family oxidoreductase [Actinopolyspora sp. BKK1]
MTFPNSTPTVVVTGASSGIGHATAVRLARNGYRVHAGFRHPEDGASLAEESPNLAPVHLDVTDPESIEALREQVEAAPDTAPLRGLVNNAGTTTAAPIEYVSPDELRRVLDVNVVGQVAVTRALLPALRRSHGRVINISSMGGRIASPVMGPYAASKFALEAITDALRRELVDQDVEVVAIEPGAVATPIWNKIDSKVNLDSVPEQARQVYGDLITGVEEGIFKVSATHGVPPERIAEVIEQALTRPHPRARYLVGRSARMRVMLSRILPPKLFDLLLSGVMRRIGARTRTTAPASRRSS